MTSDYLLAVCSCAIGVALLVVSLAFPPKHEVVRVKRVPIYVRVAESPWSAFPEVAAAGGGHPVEAR